MDHPLRERTELQNLFGYRPSGAYLAKVGGRPIRQSLETNVLSRQTGAPGQMNTKTGFTSLEEIHGEQMVTDD